MQARLTTKPEQHVLSAIQALDLESIKNRLMDPVLGEGWTRVRAERIETEYKQFLTVLVKYQDDAEDVLLSEDVDEFWHTHILHTIKYTEDCEWVFGKYLHHNPGQAPLDRERSIALAEKTRSLYQQVFRGGQVCHLSPLEISAKGREPAVCNVAIRADRPAVCNVAIQAERSAVCNVAIKAERPAVCNIAIQAKESRAIAMAA